MDARHGHGSMNCDDCGAKIDPETDRHALVTEQLVAPDLGSELADGRAVCGDCADVSDARLAPR